MLLLKYFKAENILELIGCSGRFNEPSIQSNLNGKSPAEVHKLSGLNYFSNNIGA